MTECFIHEWVWLIFTTINDIFFYKNYTIEFISFLKNDNI